MTQLKFIFIMKCFNTWETTSDITKLLTFLINGSYGLQEQRFKKFYDGCRHIGAKKGGHTKRTTEQKV